MKQTLKPGLYDDLLTERLTEELRTLQGQGLSPILGKIEDALLPEYLTRFLAARLGEVFRALGSESVSQLAAAIQNTPGAKVRKLKTVEMQLNQQGTPWPEFPGLNVSATASKDFKLITITSHAVGDEPGQFPNIWDDMPFGSTMNFGIRTKDTKIERRLLIRIEAVK